jgi:uncharacterized protein (DUF2237 family)
MNTGRKLNVYGETLMSCNKIKITGYQRDGFCTNLDFDAGTHIVCAVVTDSFLQFTKTKGNDLITPGINFSGLKTGDTWCLCVTRWIEAYKNGKAPSIIGRATDISVLKYVPVNIIKQYLIDKL